MPGTANPMPPAGFDSIPGLDDIEPAEEDMAAGASPLAPGPDGEPAPDAKAGPAAAPTALPGSPLFVGGFGSEHPGGAQFAMGDGRIRYLPTTMSLAVLQQMAHRNDGKLPPSEP
jgi:hypothetical protein